MRKAFVVLALIASACDFSRVVLVHGDPVRKPEAAVRGDDYEHRKEPREKFDSGEVSRESPENSRDERLSEPVGRWRSNGEALEPKWRDGDSVPLLPFSHYRSFSRDDVDDVEREDLPGMTLPLKHRYSVNRNRPRGSSDTRRAASPDEYDYESTYRNRDEDYPHKRRRFFKSSRDSTLYEETIEDAANNDGKRGRDVVDEPSSDDKDVTSARYREAFQARPNAYEHEFDDEEYLRPRPRKRRPPQNYEFALANEASSEEVEELKGNSQPSSQPSENESPSATRNEARYSGNAFELKSLLKMQQEEGSSLSEILQRRNLTLSDLLKGKADVINALKSRIADESDEYIEEMSRVMSNSLMKLAATVSPPSLRLTQASTMLDDTTTEITSMTPVASSGTLDDSLFSVTDEASTKRYDAIPTKEASRTKGESANAELITQERSKHDSMWLGVTTPPSISTVITTSTSPPAASSVEYFMNDDGSMGLIGDRGTRLESLDEDEIMEFSDFMDFKKAKNLRPEAWSSEESASRRSSNRPADDPRDIGSTLSIEQILNPTERIGLTEDEKEIHDHARSFPISKIPVNGYNGSIKVEYRNAATINGTRNAAKTNSSVSRSTARPTERKHVMSPARDEDRTTESRQVLFKNEEDHASENYRGANGKRYEEVVSEIEPEARAEIFELFASGSAGKRLERLLKSRNMSVEELIALRQRGSSKVHLTEMSRLRVPKPKSSHTMDGVISENTGNRKIVISLSSTNDKSSDENAERKHAQKDTNIMMNRLKDQVQDIVSYLHDPLFDKDVENMSMSRLLDLVERDRNASRGVTFSGDETQNADEYDELENSRRTMQIVDLLTTFGSLPFAKDVQRQFNTEVGDNERIPETRLPVDNDNASAVLINDQEETRTARWNDSSNEFHAGYMEEIAREKPNIVDIRTVYGGSETVSSANGKSIGEERRTLSKMKPSIIVSGAILGVTIVVFLAIFIVCRIRQRQKYTYRNTFSRAVFQGPVSAARKLSNSSSLSAVMVNVVGTSTTRRPERMETQEATEEFDSKSDMDNDSLDANDSWETIPDYAK